MTTKLFSFLSKMIQEVESIDAKLELAKFCGKLASKNYCGLFRDKSIESFFQSFKHENLSLKAIDTKQIVHVFTTTYITGGHTRFLENLIQLDDKFLHHLIVTDQGEVPIRQSLIDLIELKGGTVNFLVKDDFENQISNFRKFIFEKASKVMLHIHPHDILPSIALQGKPKELEVFFFNHADHLFSFGCDVSDKIINIREEAHRISFHERFMQQSYVLPLPIIKTNAQVKDLESIREKFSVKENDIIGVAMGNPEKFYKNSKHHFFRTIAIALKENPRLKVFVVGIGKEDFCPELDIIEHDRLFFLGIQKDPTEIQTIADIAIDPMPIGSYTALLETCYYGAYPLVCYDTICLFDLYNDAAFFGKIKLDLTEKNYLEHFHRICEGKVEMTKSNVSSSIKETHTGAFWLNNFHSIMEDKESHRNEAVPLPSNLSRFNEFNLPDCKVRYSVLSFFYENIHLFNRLEAFKIVIYLLMNRFSKRESLGILKKSFQGQ